MPLSDEKKEELTEELPKVSGSSVQTKPGTDPDEAFDTDVGECADEG